MEKSLLARFEDWDRNQPRFIELGVLLWLCVIGFLWLGDRPLEAWDESRFGENALWQLRYGDWINGYYAGVLDTWNVKPPLARWMICLGYLLFGENTFGLRVFSAIAVILATWLFYKWIRVEAGNRVAIPFLLIITSSGAWFGYHVGQTGDSDAFLLLGLLLTAIFGYRYLQSSSWKDGLLVLLGIGIGFWSKSFLGYLFIPAIVIWAALSADRRKILFSRKTIVLGMVSLIWPLLWFLLTRQYGLEFPENEFLGTNAWETMIQYDFLARATQQSLEGVATAGSQSTVLSSLDVRLGPWFYLSILGIILWAARKQREHSFWAFSAILLGFCTLVFSLTSTYLNWYLVPVLGFYAAFAAYAIYSIIQRKTILLWIMGFFWLGIQSWNIYSSRPVVTEAAKTLHSILEETTAETPIQLIQYAPQDLQLLADWTSDHVTRRFSPIDNDEMINTGGIIIGMFDQASRELLLNNGYKVTPYKGAAEIWRLERD